MNVRWSLKTKSIATLFLFTAVTGGLLFTFQNCSHGGFKAAVPHGETVATSSPSTQGRSCRFNGADVNSGDTRTAFLNSTEPVGGTCKSETRTCTDGTLSGSYNYAGCEVNKPASCLFNGVTVESGKSVDAYSTSTVPAGSACVLEKRECNNGQLSGSFTYGSCTVDQATSCVFDGVTLTSGETVTAYSHSKETSPATCTQETRVCMNGTLSGSYQYSSCNVDAPASCLFNGQTIPSGADVYAYREPSVADNSYCMTEIRVCDNGTLRGSFANPTCVKQGAGSCTYKGQTVGSGYSITGYASATVPAGQVCTRQDAQCNNGVITGYFASSTCTVLPATSMPAMQPLNETFEMVMSETPNLILTAFDHYGPHKADLTLTGVAPDYPGFKVKARVTFDSGTYRDWILQSINYENLPSGFSAPIVAIDAWYSDFKARYVNVGSGGSSRYRMTWTIAGQATPQVRPVYLPRMSSTPWIGEKKGKVLKIRGNEPLNPNQAPYDKPGGLQSSINEMTAKLNAQSNHLVNMTFDVAELQYIAPSDQADCSNIPYDDEFKRQMFAQNGVTAENYNFDWLIYTYYPSFGAQFASSCFDVYRTGMNGGVAATQTCPMCSPGGEVVRRANLSYWPEDYGIFMHELGHGMNLHDQYANDLAPCTDSDPRNVKEAQLFRIDNSCGYLHSPLFEQTMGNGRNWHDPIERSHLGWLKAGQVLTVSRSGTYDLYTDNNDYSSDPTKPLILQLAIKRQGKIDFVYIITFNPAIIADLGTTVDQESKDYIANSIRLSTSNGAHRYGLAWASAGDQNFYSYFNNDPSVTYKHTIPPNVDVRINFGDTDVTLRLVEKTSTRARVQVTYNKPLL